MALQYSDIVMVFAAVVAYAAIAPWIYNVIDKMQTVVDPLTAVILGAFPALILIGLILSAGVGARS